MKFSCQQTGFNAVLSQVIRAVPSRPTHPVLGNVLIAADPQQGRVSLTSFDLSLGIHASFHAEISEGGKVALPAKLFNDIVSRLPEGELQLVTEATTDISATLTAASGQFQIRGMGASEFPELPAIGEGEALVLPVAALLEGLRGVLFAASADEIKPILTGIHLTGTQDSLEFAATDGHRLAVVKTPLDNSEATIADFSMTIPARALRELERMLASYSLTDDLSLHVSDSQVIFELDGSRLTSRKLEGAYPAYRQLIPRSFERHVSLERKRLLSSLERCAVLSDNNHELTKFTFDASGGELVISIESKDIGSARESMPAEITGASGKIAFNVKYLMDGLKALPADKIEMHWNGSNQPAIFTPLAGVKMTFLVMPITIYE